MQVSALIPIINQVFRTAKIDIVIVELVILQEQVIIGSPPVESLEKELKVIEKTEDIELGGRYMATGLLSSQGRSIPVFVRFYITSDGKLRVEDSIDDGSTLTSTEEFDKPNVWKEIIEYVAPWAPIIVRLILHYCGIISGDV